MKNSKRILLFLFIALHISTNAQTKDTLAKKNIIFKSYFSDFKTPDYSIDFKNVIPKKNSHVSIFNESMYVYDHYIHTGKEYTYTNSTLYYDNSNSIINLILDQKASLMQNNAFMQNEYKYPIRDSFNPHGATNMKQAVLGGFLGLLFNE